MRTTWSFRAMALGVATVLAVTGAANAQQSVPAETPPASFRGEQYVDSRGCVFVRVGFGAATEWVPRVGRDRRQICGQSPTRVAGASAPAASPARTQAGVTVIGGTPAAPSTPAPAPARTASAPAAPAAPAAASIFRQTTTPATGGTVRVAPPAARTGTVVRTAPAASGCARLGGITGQILGRPGERCGPQAVHPGDAARGIVRPGPTFNPAAASIPEGYRPAWEDGRINPMRGVQTYAGQAETRLYWTDTVPRRLVGSPEPRGLLSWFSGQNPELETAAASSRSVAPRTRAVRTPEVAAPAPTAVAAPAPAPAAREAAPAIRVASDHRHVLIGTFATQAEAARAHARVGAAGLPARLGRIDRASGAVFVVTAGPYANPNDLVSGLRAAHRAGFTGATTRR